MRKKNTRELENILEGAHTKDFAIFYENNRESMMTEQESFPVYMKNIFREKKMTQQMVFLKADIPERYGYKILSGEKHTKQRDTILRICYAAELTLEETQEALKKYEMPVLNATSVSMFAERCFTCFHAPMKKRRPKTNSTGVANNHMI